ncbi:ATP-grasp domain-containing protein [Sphingobium rhizovicinum]|uniref:ATP-grasp domain-containing protein n=1 Tax=Sphingobium rhizovicinum TaxID=432308 RepID=A0ABV7NNI3_9SPHN
MAQDRLAEKRFVCDLGGLTAPFAPVESLDDLEAAIEQVGSRAILKTNRMGYDGKGQARLSEPGDAVAHGAPSAARAPY